ncbi:MAG: RNA-binding protein [Firmicutes bacterium]|nr:RNA-binding protein [Bacillota bacterium]
MDVQVGQLATSIAGRDAGQQFLVIGFTENRVLVTDGETRRVECPKRKNPKHLCPQDMWAEDIRAKLLGSVSVSNADIREALEKLQDDVRGVDR